MKYFLNQLVEFELLGPIRISDPCNNRHMEVAVLKNEPASTRMPLYWKSRMTIPRLDIDTFWPVP